MRHLTKFFLIRHGLTDAVAGRQIAGRAPGARLNEKGRAQAESLAERLSVVPLRAVYSSPLERALETAVPIARRLDLEVQVEDAFNELEFGEWTGRTFEELEASARWRAFNSFRGGTRIPGGELMVEAQARAVAGVERLRERHAGESVAVVSHADLIRAVVAHYAGIHLDLLLRIEVGPASFSVVEVGDFGPRIISLNDTGGLTQ